MQLNVYVPRDRADLLERLDQLVRLEGRNKNQIVLEALEEYIRARLEAEQPFLVCELGVRAPWTRGDLYEERLDRASGMRGE
ncbi:MAG: ribbon-helix-helix protein, CopG family [Candidatus Eremiobacterota bacterium]